MFSRRSLAQRHLAAVRGAAARARVFVLGGDIFDLSWSTLGSLETTIEHGVRWLSEILEENVTGRFHYVLGNHDYNQRLMARLDDLARRLDHFSWHPYYVRLGDKLFLHGDVADRTMDQAALARRRSKWLRHRRRGRLASLTYDAAISARLHKMVMNVVHAPHKIAPRIAAYLESIDQGPRSGVRHVYFGHTHDAISDYRYNDLVLHNGGAPLKGLQFKVVPFHHE